MENIYAYIRNIGCFVVFSAVVRLLAPQGSFKDCINLFLSLIFTVIMLNPLSGFIKTDLPRLSDYIIKNGAETGAELFGDEEKNRELVSEEYRRISEERIGELCEGYIEGAEVSVKIDDDFNVSEVYIKGEIIKDTTELKELICGLFGTEPEKIKAAGELEE